MIDRDGAMFLASEIAYKELNYDWKAAEVRYYFQELASRDDADEYYFTDALKLMLPGPNIVGLLQLYAGANMDIDEMGYAIIEAAWTYYTNKIREQEKEQEEAEVPRYDASQPRDFSDLEEDKDDE